MSRAIEQLHNTAWERGDLSYMYRPTQAEVSSWWHDHDALLTIVHARRGFGKTVFMLLKAFEHMATHPNSRIVYAAPTREETKKIVLPTAKLLIPKELDSSIVPIWHSSDHAYIHPNGSSCVIEGADDDQGDHLRGPFADLALLDELGFWRFADYVYRSVLFPMVERRNGRMLGVSTSPKSPQHEFATILVNEAKAEGAYVKVTLDDDYTVTQEKRDKIAAQYSRTRDPEDGRKTTQYRREFNCEFVTESERAVVPEFDIAVHVGEHEEPEYYDRYVYMDQGFVDLTHVLFAYYDFKQATIIVQDEIAKQHVTISELAPMILAHEKALWGDKKVRKRASDSPPIALAEFARQHMLQPKLVPREIRFASVDNRDPEGLINRTRSLFAVNRIKINPRCTELIRQVQGGLWNEKRTDFERIAGLGHLDGVCALAYLVDGIDYQTNPATMQTVVRHEDYPTERMQAPRDAQQQSLAKLLPRFGRRKAHA